MKPVLLGAYRLIAKLGRGRVTDVYLAVRDGHASKDNLVVVKRLRTARSNRGDARAQDVTIGPEVELAPFLHHPNIATMHEVNQSGSAPFWAMEYVEGQPLDRVLATANRSGGLPVSFGLRMLCDLLSALDYAHNLVDDSGKPLGIVHRDVRPHNIFISYQGELKLLDFGIPRPAVARADSSTSSDSGRAYVAPEQALSGSVDRRADVFAVGLVMWELLSKQRRATGEIPVATLHGLQPEITTEQGSIDSEISAELSRINDRALERAPDERYATAEEMRNELEAVLVRMADPRCVTQTMARANIGSLMQRLFKSERSDAARRVQLLLAVDTLSGPERPADAVLQTAPGANGAKPPALRSSQADQLASGASKPPATMPPLPRRDAATSGEVATAAPEEAQPGETGGLLISQDSPALRGSEADPSPRHESQDLRALRGDEADSRTLRDHHDSRAPRGDEADSRTLRDRHDSRALRGDEADSSPLRGDHANPSPLDDARYPLAPRGDHPDSRALRDSHNSRALAGDNAHGSSALRGHDADPSTLRDSSDSRAPRGHDADPTPLRIALDSRTLRGDSPDSSTLRDSRDSRALRGERADSRALRIGGAEFSAAAMEAGGWLAGDARVQRPDRTDSRLSEGPRVSESGGLGRTGRASKPEGRGLSAVAAVLLVLTAVGATWSITRPAAKQETQTAAAVTAPEPATKPVLRLCGSNTVGAELAPALVEALFAEKDSAAKLTHKRNIDSDVTQLLSKSDDKTLSAEITARGTATGFAGLADRSCDVGMASRAISAEEAKRLRDKGLGDLSSPANEHVIALDGVAVVVHPNNPLHALDRQTLHDIFTGKATDWSEVGGAAGPIHVNARDDQSGTYDTFHHLVLGNDQLVASAKRYARSDALADAVASDPAAIGFVGLAYVRTAKALAVGEAGAAPLLPTQFTVATEGYMLSRRLYFYTPDRPSSPWVTELVNFAMSPHGQEIAGKAGFVNLSLLTENSGCSGNCPARYQATVQRAQRVSVDLRFRSGSNQPDSRARRDIDRLVNFLQNFREAKVLLLGFSDSVGGVSSNLRLSEDRARAIADQLAMRGIHASLVTGFGAEMPVATNETESGRERNRRVEVWFEHR